VVEVTEGQFAQSAIDGSAEAEACEVGLGNAPPQSILAIDGENVVVVANSFEIHQEGRAAIDAESCGCNESAFEAVPFAFAQNAPG